VIEINEIETFKTFKDKFLKSDLFSNENYDILFVNYYEILNRKNEKDIILDVCTILDNIFTKGPNIEVAFRVALNGALFISPNFLEFVKNYEFFNITYHIRSIIIHGSNWKHVLNDRLNNLSISNTTEYILILKEKINKIVNKFIDLSLNNENIINTLENDLLFFLKSSDILIRDQKEK